MDRNKLEWHDFYKPIYAIDLCEIDPARHIVILECWLGCGHVEILDVPARIAAGGGNESIRSIARHERCPNCGRRNERDYQVRMREGVAPRSLEEVRPSERKPLPSR